MARAVQRSQRRGVLRCLGHPLHLRPRVLALAHGLLKVAVAVVDARVQDPGDGVLLHIHGASVEEREGIPVGGVPHGRPQVHQAQAAAPGLPLGQAVAAGEHPAELLLVLRAVVRVAEVDSWSLREAAVLRAPLVRQPESAPCAHGPPHSLAHPGPKLRIDTLAVLGSMVLKLVLGPLDVAKTIPLEAPRGLPCPQVRARVDNRGLVPLKVVRGLRPLAVNLGTHLDDAGI
mmetsp:Transcript_107572/g.286262  ORF Transcript_107572/g.286262 Transcript_107572/m.286262 type:complete len:231 (-) Transcript_107572:144-836(-)